MSRSRPRARTLRRFGAAALLAALLPALAACTGGSTSGPSTSSSPSTSSAAISAKRCAENKAAGHITFLTGYGFVGSPGIIDVLAASQLGYFSALCLDVDVKAGVGTNAALVSAGTAQIANFGGASDVLTADTAGGRLTGIATYGNTGLARLIALKKSGYTSLRSFEGKVIGYHYAAPPQVEAMLVAAGVPLSKVKFASVATNPLLLTTGDFTGMTGYVSNDVPTLQAAGHPVTVWDPATYGVKSTFSTQAANTAWATAHPTAVEDFLRASFHAFAWMRASSAHVTTALDWAAARSTGYQVAVERRRWTIESGLVVSSLPAGDALGQQSVTQWTPEAKTLLQYHLVKSAPDVAAALSTAYVGAISRGGTTVWPAP